MLFPIFGHDYHTKMRIHQNGLHTFLGIGHNMGHFGKGFLRKDSKLLLGSYKGCPPKKKS